MKPRSLLICSLLAWASAPAHTPETAIIAAMKLSEQPSYGWFTTVNDDAQTYTLEGKTEKGGYTWQRQPMPKAIARRLGRGAPHQLEAIFRNAFHYVVATEDGWRLPSELPRRAKDWSDESDMYYAATPLLRTPDMPADERDLGRFGLPPVVYLPVVKARASDDFVYSNCQFALGLPHQELAVIVSSHTDLQIEGDVVSGSLSDLGAQLLLVHDGHEYIQPVTAAGRFKLWLKNGLVEKYLLELAGILALSRETHYVRQNSTTILSGVGSTSVEVSPEVRQRL